MSLKNFFNFIAKHSNPLIALLAVVAFFGEYPPFR